MKRFCIVLSLLVFVTLAPACVSVRMKVREGCLAADFCIKNESQQLVQISMLDGEPEVSLELWGDDSFGLLLRGPKWQLSGTSERGEVPDVLVLKPGECYSYSTYFVYPNEGKNSSKLDKGVSNWVYLYDKDVTARLRVCYGIEGEGNLLAISNSEKINIPKLLPLEGD